MENMPQRIGARPRSAWPVIACLAASLLLAGCLNSTPGVDQSQQPASDRPTGTPFTFSQPGSNGTVFAGAVTYQGDIPPAGSSLYLALVTSPDDTQRRTCIDAERDPLSDKGVFVVQVACEPQAGDQLYYTLIIGAAGDRNWHSGVMPLPSDQRNIRIDVAQ
jgi:hypothetical protein